MYPKGWNGHDLVHMRLCMVAFLPARTAINSHEQRASHQPSQSVRDQLDAGQRRDQLMTLLFDAITLSTIKEALTCPSGQLLLKVFG